MSEIGSYSHVPLGELVTIQGGGTPSRGKEEYWSGDIPWATIKDLTASKIVSTQESITKIGLEKSASRLIAPNAIILGTRMAVGRVAIAAMPIAINQDLKALTCNEKISPYYLFHFLRAKEAILSEEGKGATVKGITLDILRNLLVPLPPLEEQRRIAAILDKADAIRRKRQEALKLADDLVKSQFIANAPVSMGVAA